VQNADGSQCGKGYAAREGHASLLNDPCLIRRAKRLGTVCYTKK